MGYSVTLGLTTKSEREAELRADGCRASVAIESAKVRVSDVGATTLDEAQAKARAVAPKLLDILCSLYDHCLRLEVGDPATDRIDSVQCALIEADDGTMAFRLEDGVRCSFKHRVQSHDAAGNVIADSWKPGLIPFEHLPAMASFRSAKLTENVFHKYRDFYLAIENADGQLHHGPESSELLERALATLYGADPVRLCDLLAKVGIVCLPQDAVSEAKRFLWKVHRLPLFHAAKNTRVVSDPKDEEEVENALPLAQAVARDMIRAAAEKVLRSATRP